MHIAVNARLLLPDKMEGIGWFACETLKRMVQAHPRHRFTFVFDRPFRGDFLFADNVKGIWVPPQSRHPLLWYLYFHVSLPRALKRLKPDVFFSPENYLAVPCPCPSLVTMHDVAYERWPDTVPAKVLEYYRKYFPRYGHAATQVATVSEFSKAEIQEVYGISGEKIAVVPNGVSEQFRPLDDFGQQAVRNALTGGAPYFFFVGGLQKRKNIPRLIEAFDLMKSRSQMPHKLVVAGRPANGWDDIQKAHERSQSKEDILFPGRLPGLQLAQTMASASALCYLSLYEGFGVPCLEAMNCGVPVLASNTSSLPEVCGQAALFAHPENTEEIAAQMARLATDGQLREHLRQKGFLQAQKYTWDAAAASLWQSIEKTIGT